MITNKKNVASLLVALVLLMYSFVPSVLASTTVEISGNGSYSNNDAKIDVQQDTTVVQKNDAKITNDIKSETETGDNNANDNTNGNVSINTGNASSTANTSTTVNLNKAKIDNCGTCNGDTSVKISGNGSDSKNDVKLDNKNTTEVFQDNKAHIDNKIKAETETGDNNANRNTGGDVSIRTGNATSNVSVSNQANANLISVGGGANSSSTGSLSAEISGNGSGSDNSIKLKADRSITVVQDNNAKINNDIDVEAETGENTADDNTGGVVEINTGAASVTVNVDNLANFNTADVDCCVVDTSVKISGNGSDSKNKIDADLDNDLSVFQGGKESSGNDADIKNKLKSEAETGDNDANRNTDPTDDPSITTGDASDSVTVSNTGNANLFGSDILDGTDLDVDFDLSALFDLLTGLV